MTTKEMREKEDAYLLQELKEQMRHLFNLRTQAVTEKLEDPSQINKTRRHIARVKTILRERSLKVAHQAGEALSTKVPAETAGATAAAPAAGGN
jgi:large subunit ribosomal protein L29